MKRNTGLLLVALLAALTLLVSGCGEKQQTPDGAPDEPLMQEKDLTIEPKPAQLRPAGPPAGNSQAVSEVG